MDKLDFYGLLAKRVVDDLTVIFADKEDPMPGDYANGDHFWAAAENMKKVLMTNCPSAQCHVRSSRRDKKSGKDCRDRVQEELEIGEGKNCVEFLAIMDHGNRKGVQYWNDVPITNQRWQLEKFCDLLCPNAVVFMMGCRTGNPYLFLPVTYMPGVPGIRPVEINGAPKSLVNFCAAKNITVYACAGPCGKWGHTEGLGVNCHAGIIEFKNGEAPAKTGIITWYDMLLKAHPRCK